jgi:kynurenine formamidase
MWMAQDLLLQLAEALSSGSVKVIDLSQPLGPETPVISLPEQFGKSWPFRIEEVSRYDSRGPAWYWNNITCGEHTGTHFDAPVHWATGKDYPQNTTDTIAVERLVAPACVLDISAEAAKDPDFLLTKEHVLEWEKKHGEIEAGSWLLMRSDWSKRTGAAAFLNADDHGMHTPGPDPAVVAFLANERKVMGFGTECVGTDAGQAFLFDPPFPCHVMMHGSNRFGLASLANLDQLPPKGAILITPPLKIVNGSGSPCRVLAMVSK